MDATAELAAVDEFLAGVSTGPGVLLLEGEAGAGKTTLWNAAVADATRRGFRVLSCRPAATEAKLSFGGLDDLLDGVVGEVSDSLPEPQRQALDAVLLRGPSTGADARTVCRAALETVRLLAGSGPVVLAVDDVQWLDRPSAQVVEYVVRRLGDEPVGVVLAWRSAAADALPLGLARVPWPERVRRLPVGPLSVGALHRLLQSHLELSLSRPILVRVHATSGGNPFYALEIARAVAATKQEAGGGRAAADPGDADRARPQPARPVYRPPPAMSCWSCRRWRCRRCDWWRRRSATPGPAPRSSVPLVSGCSWLSGIGSSSPIRCWRQGFMRMPAADAASPFTVGSLRSSPTRRSEPTISAWPRRTPTKPSRPPSSRRRRWR